MKEEKIYNIIYPNFQKIDNIIQNHNNELEKINKKYKLLLKYNSIFNIKYKFDEDNICCNVYNNTSIIQLIICLFTFNILLFIKFYSKIALIPLIVSLFCVALFIYFLILYIICNIMKKKFKKDIIAYSKQLSKDYIIIINEKVFIECDYIDNYSYKKLKHMYDNNIKKVSQENINEGWFSAINENKENNSKFYASITIKSRINTNAYNKAKKKYMYIKNPTKKLMSFELYNKNLKEFSEKWCDIKSINTFLKEGYLDLTNIIQEECE